MIKNESVNGVKITDVWILIPWKSENKMIKISNVSRSKEIPTFD